MNVDIADELDLNEFGEPIPKYHPKEPENRGKYESFGDALAAAAEDLLKEKDAFFDSLPVVWDKLFPGLPMRPGRYEGGRIYLYVPNATVNFIMRRKLPHIKKVLSELPNAPKKLELRVEIHSAERKIKIYSVAALCMLCAVFTRSLERVNSMDPIMAQSIYDSKAVLLVYETPLEIDYAKRPYSLASGICDLPEVSADGLEYSFRKSKKRSSPLTAHDIKRHLERLRAPESASPGSWTLKDVESIDALDDDTLKITLKKRNHVFPWMMAMSYAAVPLPDGSGTGPYRLTKWRKNHDMVFERKTLSTNGFDTVRYLVVGDASTQWLMFLKGEMDFLGEISRDNWDAIIDGGGALDSKLTAQGVTLHSSPSLDVRYIGFNMRDEVVGNNKKLRQALASAFDFEAWKRFYGGRVDFADGPVPAMVAGHLDEPVPYPFNLERARSLMAEAGYPDGIDPATGRHLTLTLSIGRATQDSREQGELLASFFEKIGVRLELSFSTWGAFLKAVNEGRVQMYMMGWVGDYPDAENFLQLFYSKNASPGPNHSNYSNPKFDESFEKAMQCVNAAERESCWKDCQRIVREDVPWLFTHFPKSYSLVRPTVGNYIPSAFPYGQEQYFINNGSACEKNLR